MNAYNIQGFFPFSRATVETLIKALADENINVRVYSSSALGEATQHFDAIVPALMERLGDRDPRVREHATLALAKTGPPALPSLIKALQQMDYRNPPDPKESQGEPSERMISASSELERAAPQVSDYAALALMQMGDDAFPDLAKAFRSKTPHVQRYAAHILEHAEDSALPALAELANDPDPDVRARARSSLDYIYFSHSESTLSILRKLMKSDDDELRESAVYALRHLGVSVLKDFEDALKDRSEDVRLKAVHTLSLIVENSDSPDFSQLLLALDDESDTVKSSALKTLVDLKVKFQDTKPFMKLLKSPKAELRDYGAKALGKSANPDVAVVQALTYALKDVDSNVQSSAANSLGLIGNKARPAIPHLIEALKTAQPKPKDEYSASFYEEVLIALGNIGENSPGVTHVLIDSLKAEDGRIQIAAASGLKALGKTAARDSIPALTEAIRAKLAAISTQEEDSNSTIDNIAVGASLRSFTEALLEIGPDGISAFLSLLSNTKSELLQEAAAAVLENLKSHDEQIGHLLALLFKSTKAAVRGDAVEAISKRQPITGDMFSTLAKALKDPSENVRDAALESLNEIGPKARLAAPTLRGLLRHSDTKVRADAAETLSVIDPADQLAIRTLIKELKAEAISSSDDYDDYFDYHDAVPALAKIGAPAVPAVVRALKDPHPVVRRIASRILLVMCVTGGRPKGALPSLVRALKDPDAGVRRNAAKAVGEMGPVASSPEAAEALTELLTDADKEVRVAAASALLGIGFEVRKVISTFSTIINEDFIDSEVANTLSGIINAARPTMVVTVSAGGGFEYALAAFPWPPPRFSYWYVLPKNLLGSDNNTLGDVREKLGSALSSLGYDSQGLFAVPQGFALVTRVERFNEDGTPSPAPTRWTSGRLAPRTVGEYLRTLVMEKPGQFRLFVFIFTPLGNFGHSNRSLSESEAWSLSNEGGRVLPPHLQQTSFRGYFSHALIYVLKKRAGEAATIEYQDPLGPEMHLRRSGILNRL